MWLWGGIEGFLITDWYQNHDLKQLQSYCGWCFKWHVLSLNYILLSSLTEYRNDGHSDNGCLHHAHTLCWASYTRALINPLYLDRVDLCDQYILCEHLADVTIVARSTILRVGQITLQISTAGAQSDLGLFSQWDYMYMATPIIRTCIADNVRIDHYDIIMLIQY